MDILNFKVSSELKSILGRDLIVNDYIAILELVKNAYDAYATNVEITFENDCITIVDNGKGMTLDDIKEKWLFVGFSAKRDGTEDLKRSSFRNKIRRNYAGAKGIGRLSCDRLSQKLILITKSADISTTERLIVDWGDFDKNQRNRMETIEIPHETLTEVTTFIDNNSHGTRLELRHTHEIWNRAKILNLRKVLEKMINPFQNQADEFHIVIKAKAEADDDWKVDESRRVNGEITNSIEGILSIKTTRIESRIDNEIIRTRLVDRDVVMYEIEENNNFEHLRNAAVSIFYLNRAAKYNFSRLMGMQPSNYGSIFLFRNGIRILPYGEPNDDSWGLDKRHQQGYNRYLGTRDLLGRVNVETSNLDDFKEVSSRDGGLINSPSSQDLFSYFEIVHRRLERYVAGVLWGDNFLTREYFQNEEDAKKIKEQLKEKERDSDTADHLYENIGSKIDFMQLIKSLANEKNVKIISYNKELANIVSNVKATDIIRTNLIDNLEKIIAANSDKYQQDELRKLREDIEDLYKRREATQRALDAQLEKNRYLSSVRNTSKEVEDLMHAIKISADKLNKGMHNLISSFRDKENNESRILEQLERMKLQIERITQLSKLVTKADIAELRQKKNANVVAYVLEYLTNFSESLFVTFENNVNIKILKKVSLLDLSIVLDNIVSNSYKANAKQLHVTISNDGETIVMIFSDDGDGVDLVRYNPNDIFEEGVTNRLGGAGIGLSTIRKTMETCLNGTVSFLGNGLYGMNGASFELKFK